MAEINRSITVELKPTVTLESAVLCVQMVNMFLDGTDMYDMGIGDDGKWKIVRVDE